jgi:hypothetical protein
MTGTDASTILEHAARKTVELHLGDAYGKLGIRSPKALPEALSP